MNAPTLERSRSCPEPGVVEAFDRGWDAHEIGLDRETVAVFAHPTARDWALLGWDARQTVYEMAGR